MSSDTPPESADAEEASEPANSIRADKLTSSIKIPASSKKQAFDDVMQPLTPDELSNPGTQKVILYMLSEAKIENTRLDGFVERFHDADKRAAILQEQLTSERKVSRSTDIAFGVGTALGGALMGAGYFLWSKTPPATALGWFFFIVGLGLLLGGGLVKFVRR